MDFTETVEMRPACVWECPHCDTEHFVKATLHEMDEEAHGRTMEVFDLGEEQAGGHFLSVPLEVTCTTCKRTFKTVDFDDCSGLGNIDEEGVGP